MSMKVIILEPTGKNGVEQGTIESAPSVVPYLRQPSPATLPNYMINLVVNKSGQSQKWATETDASLGAFSKHYRTLSLTSLRLVAMQSTKPAHIHARLRASA